MSIVRIRENSPILRIEFIAEDGKRDMGRIGHAVEGEIDWQQTARRGVTVTETKDGLDIEFMVK